MSYGRMWKYRSEGRNASQRALYSLEEALADGGKTGIAWPLSVVSPAHAAELLGIVGTLVPAPAEGVEQGAGLLAPAKAARWAMSESPGASNRISFAARVNSLVAYMVGLVGIVRSSERHEGVLIAAVKRDTEAASPSKKVFLLLWTQLGSWLYDYVSRLMSSAGCEQFVRLVNAEVSARTEAAQSAPVSPAVLQGPSLRLPWMDSPLWRGADRAAPPARVAPDDAPSAGEPSMYRAPSGPGVSRLGSFGEDVGERLGDAGVGRMAGDGLNALASLWGAGDKPTMGGV